MLAEQIRRHYLGADGLEHAGLLQEARVQLVVPAPLVGKFPGTVQSQLQTFESFVGDVRLVGLDDQVRP